MKIFIENKMIVNILTDWPNDRIIFGYRLESIIAFFCPNKEKWPDIFTMNLIDIEYRFRISHLVLSTVALLYVSSTKLVCNCDQMKFLHKKCIAHNFHAHFSREIQMWAPRYNVF